MGKEVGIDDFAQSRRLFRFFDSDLAWAIREGDFDDIRINGICQLVFSKRLGLRYIKYLIKRVIYGDPKDRLPFEKVKRQLERHGRFISFK